MTLYMIKDWTSAVDIRNELNPSLRIKVNIYRNCHEQAIDGYSIEVYDKDNKCGCCCENGLLYKFDVDCIIPGHYSLSTPEAIEFLNFIGFNCDFDYTVFSITDKVREQLTHLYELGYKTIVRGIRPWARIFLSTNPEDDIARKLYTYKNKLYFEKISLPTGVISPNTLDYRDYFWLTPNKPTPIKQILGIKDWEEGEQLHLPID